MTKIKTAKQVENLRYRNIKGDGKADRYSTDTIGLTLTVSPNNLKAWYFQYSFRKKRGNKSLGRYPAISLKQARILRDEFQEAFDKGINPNDYAQSLSVQSNQYTLEKLLREWHEYHYTDLNQKQAATNLRRMEKHLFPKIKNILADDMTSFTLLNIMDEITKTIVKNGKGSGRETVRRLAQFCSQAFEYGCSHGLCKSNPAATTKKSLKPSVVKHQPALTRIEDIKQLFVKINGYKGDYPVLCALRLSFLFALRPSEIVSAKWENIDLEHKEWILPGSDMKDTQKQKAVEDDHYVPLSKQALIILRDMHQHAKSPYVFQSVKKPRQPISSQTVNSALKRMGYKGKHTAHGFRGTFSTIMREVGKFPHHVIERQMGHKESNEVIAAYDRSQYHEERRIIMDWLGELYDHLNQPDKYPMPERIYL
jgi:integrase